MDFFLNLPIPANKDLCKHVICFLEILNLALSSIFKNWLLMKLLAIEKNKEIEDLICFLIFFTVTVWVRKHRFPVWLDIVWRLVKEVSFSRIFV